MLHELKAWPVGFGPMWNGAKTAEFRKDDRGYAEGDLLILREYQPEANTYTGRALEVRVNHVERGFGIPDGHATLSLQVLWRWPNYQGAGALRCERCGEVLMPDEGKVCKACEAAITEALAAASREEREAEEAGEDEEA